MRVHLRHEPQLIYLILSSFVEERCQITLQQLTTYLSMLLHQKRHGEALFRESGYVRWRDVPTGVEDWEGVGTNPVKVHVRMQPGQSANRCLGAAAEKSSSSS